MILPLIAGVFVGLAAVFIYALMDAASRADDAIEEMIERERRVEK